MHPIRLRGARTHNLQGVDLDLRPGELVGVAGVSGAGKSSLALDTLYSEGQRRFVESFSPYARQFLERLERPPIDSLDPVAAGVAVDRHAPVKSSRSTVATMADIEPYFCALFAREAVPICPEHGVAAVRTDPVAAAARAAAAHQGATAIVTYRVPVPSAEAYLTVRENLLTAGYRRLLLHGEARDLDEIKPSEVVSAKDGVEVVVDRVKVYPRDQRRLGAAIEEAWKRAGGAAALHVSNGAGGAGYTRMAVAQGLSCPVCARGFDPPQVGLFSYQSPTGACPECRGFGRTIGIDLEQGGARRVAIHQGRRRAGVVGGDDEVGAEHAAQVLREEEDPGRPAVARAQPRAAGGGLLGRGDVDRGQVPGRARVVQVAGGAHVQDARPRAARALPLVRSVQGVRRQAALASVAALPCGRPRPRRVARARAGARGRSSRRS